MAKSNKQRVAEYEARQLAKDPVAFRAKQAKTNKEARKRKKEMQNQNPAMIAMQTSKMLLKHAEKEQKAIAKSAGKTKELVAKTSEKEQEALLQSGSKARELVVGFVERLEHNNGATELQPEPEQGGLVIKFPLTQEAREIRLNLDEDAVVYCGARLDPGDL
jgi:hypothetical protein